jgi:polyphosphate kinase 2 (PPK2 family)
VRSEAFARRSLVLVFEGMDAAGKGGAIRRVTQALDTRQYAVIPIAAPTDEERAQPYLWRFWRRLPRREGGDLRPLLVRPGAGRAGRGLCSEADWMRAYAEINDFEDQLVSAGAIVLKFWLSVSRTSSWALQGREARPSSATRSPRTTGATAKMARLRARRVRHDRPHQHRERGLDLVEADNKYFARVKILTELVDKLESASGNEGHLTLKCKPLPPRLFRKQA